MKQWGAEAVMENQWLSKLKERHEQGHSPGMFAVCSAHPVVLVSAMEMARSADRFLLVEATANQVNQFGGYTGMTPEAFVDDLLRLARHKGLPARRLLIGADHLGPHLWKGARAEEAMALTEALVRRCVSAGFVKIHLDTGARCASDPGPLLPLELAARRAAELCAAAEDAAKQLCDEHRPLYVIGNETPLPGGDLQEGRAVIPTDPHQLDQTLDAFQRAFYKKGLQEAWLRILAVVVQPGVEFGDRQVAVYRHGPAARLSAAYDRLPGSMTFEVHATDYQPPEALRQLVDDHFTLLKVGPCLTFALRRTLYALGDIEAALPGVAEPARLAEVMERLMLAHPAHWQSHLRGSDEELHDLRHHSLRDRIRYYWSFPEAQRAVERLLQNLRRPISLTLLQEYLPALSDEIQRNGMHGDPLQIIEMSLRKVLEGYVTACWR